MDEIDYRKAEFFDLQGVRIKGLHFTGQPHGDIVLRPDFGRAFKRAPNPACLPNQWWEIPYMDALKELEICQ